VLLVTLARLNALLGGLGLGDGPLNGNEPSVALGSGLSLEGVLVAGDLDGEGNEAVLVEVSGIGLSLLVCTLKHRPRCTHQVQNTSRMLLLVGVLDEKEETLASLAGPRDNGVSDLGLLAAKVLPQVVRCDGLLAEPEVLLGEAEGAVLSLAVVLMYLRRLTHFFRPGAL
jgi:hypothetical protein